ncbi:MAG TPA: 4'-phosphopantetheinyl transferase superfamily protein [Gemmatimonadaceae bacterium]
MTAPRAGTDIIPCWPVGPDRPELGADDVHVWSISLDAHGVRLDALARELSDEERSRAGRFVFDADRARFVTGHARLRTILARYLDVAPSALRFGSNAFGKPRVTCGEAVPPIRFNFSHSGRLALCAVARARDVGVDVERIEASESLDEIADRFFSPDEAEALDALPPAQRCQAFYACWSRKEAYVKGHGRGMSMPLDSFDVSLLPGDQDALLADRNECEQSVWTLCDLCPAPGFAAALAVEGRGASISCFHLTESVTLPSAS